MADITTPSNWILDGRDTYPEFDEVVNRDSQGAITSQKIQKRNVYQFRRHRIEPVVWTGGTLPDTDVGDQADPAALSAYISGTNVDAGAINTGENQKYVCVTDSHEVTSVGANWAIRRQTWEMRGLYADYTWPTS